MDLRDSFGGMTAVTFDCVMPKTKKRKKPHSPPVVTGNGHTNGNGKHPEGFTHSPPEWMSGARLRVSKDDPQSFMAGFLTSVGRRDLAQAFRTGDFDTHIWSKLSIDEIVDTFCELSPEVSVARWHNLRLQNPGWEYHVWPLTGEGDEEVEEGRAVIETFLLRLRDRHGSENIPLNRSIDNLFKRGLMVLELVMDQAGTEGLDLATPDAKTVKFEKKNDAQLGEVHVPYQEVAGAPNGRVYLDRPTIRVVALDPPAGDPYGTSMVVPAIESNTFKQGMMQDLRRVIRQQGYPRIVVKILSQILKQAMPAEEAQSAERVKKWFEKQVTDARAEYANLEPDDAYFIPDWFEVDRPVGTLDASSLGAVPAISEMLDARDARGLKMPPLLMGMRFSTTETQANREWEILTNGHQAVQHVLENAIEHMFGLLLRAAGVQGTVEFRFATLRSAEEMRDTQTATLKADLALKRYLAGWISQDAAAQQGAEVEEADWPGPRAGDGAVDENGESMAQQLMEQNPEPGSARQPKMWEAIAHAAWMRQQGRSEDEIWDWLQSVSDPRPIERASEPVRPPVAALPELPDAVSVGPEDAAAAQAGWDGVMRGYEELLDAEVTNG